MARFDVASVAELRRAAVASGWSRADRFTVTVRSSAPSGCLGPLPGLRHHDVDLGPDAVTVRLRFTDPVPFQLVAGAVLALWPQRVVRPLPVSPDIAAYGELPDWLPPARNVAPLVGAVPDLTVIQPYDQLVPGGEPPTVDKIAPASPVSWNPSVSVLAETEPPPQDYAELEYVALSGEVRAAYGRARGTVLVVTDGAGFEDPSFVRNLLQGNASAPGTAVYTRAELDRELTASSGPAGTGARSGRAS